MRKDKQSADVRGVKPGRFNEFSRGDVVLYAEAMQDSSEMLTNVFVHTRNSAETGVISADKGEIQELESGEHFVVLTTGQRYLGKPGQADYIISRFDEYAVKIDEGETQSAAMKREAAPTEELWRSGRPPAMAELQRRFSVPLGILVLSLLAIPLARMTPRSGVYGNVAVAFLIYIVYENLQKVTQAMTIGKKIPFWLGYSGVYMVMAAVVAFFVVRTYGARWLWQSVRGRA
jgi:lipopolysaccharide export system permease protein